VVKAHASQATSVDAHTEGSDDQYGVQEHNLRRDEALHGAVSQIVKQAPDPGARSRSRRRGVAASQRLS
jgi:hypothetical protein